MGRELITGIKMPITRESIEGQGVYAMSVGNSGRGFFFIIGMLIMMGLVPACRGAVGGPRVWIDDPLGGINRHAPD